MTDEAKAWFGLGLPWTKDQLEEFARRMKKRQVRVEKKDTKDNREK